MNYEGEDFELAKYTLHIAELLEGVGKEKALRVKAEKMYKAMKEVIGADELAQVVQGNNYEDCDLTILADMFNAATENYANEMNKSKNKAISDKMEMMSDLTSNVSKFSDAVKNAGK